MLAMSVFLLLINYFTITLHVTDTVDVFARIARKRCYDPGSRGTRV